MPAPKTIANRQQIRRAATGGLLGQRTRTTAVADVFGKLNTKSISNTQNYLSDYYRDGGGSPPNIYPKKELSPISKGPASIRVWQESKDKKNGTDLIPAYTKVIIESTQEAHRERSQIIETFGDYYVFFFGETPPIYNYTGTLINAENVNWVYEWQFYYENYLRGTKCAANNARVILTYGLIQVEGFILNFSTQHNAITEHGVPIQFSMVQTRRTGLQTPVDFLLSNQVIEEINSNIASNKGEGTSQPDVSQAFNATKQTAAGGAASGLAA